MKWRDGTWAVAVALVSMVLTGWMFSPDDEVALPIRGDRRVGSTPMAALPSTKAATPTAEEPGKRLTLRTGQPAWPGLAALGRGHGGWAPLPPPPMALPLPPPAATTPPSPPTPQAPPFPYEPIGQMSDAGQLTVFLGGPTRVAAVRVGDTLDGQWKVLQIRDGLLQAQWLPAKIDVQVPFRTRPGP